MSHPPLRPEEIERLIQGTGIYDPGRVPSGFAARVTAASQEHRGLFVRGARHGGSPMLNFLSRVAFFLTLLVLVSLVGLLLWGGSLLYRAVFPADPAAVVLAEKPGETLCVPVEGVRQRALVGELLGGEEKMPRELQEIATRQGKSGTFKGDRLDLFPVEGGHLSVRYQGQGERVRSVSLSFAPPLPFCDALQAAGLLPEPARFKEEVPGRWRVTEGGGAPVLREALLEVQSSAQGVQALQVSAAGS